MNLKFGKLMMMKVRSKIVLDIRKLIRIFERTFTFLEHIMRRSICSAPIPPGKPGDITFWGVASIFLSLYFYLDPP